MWLFDSVLKVCNVDPTKSLFMVFNIQKYPSKSNCSKAHERFSKSVAFGRGGSSPPTGTIFK
ncbi:hypothetical protein FCV62_05065 [Vibrio kanaloae]|nr:hypothetical protein FCV62_05065 [Vibrio kanaloae]